MSEERMRILNMLGEGKITAEEADRLLEALDQAESAARASNGAQSPRVSGKPKPVWLRIQVDEPKGDKVNLRIPLMFVRGALKFGHFMPKQAREQIKSKLQAKGMEMEFGDMLDDMFSGGSAETWAALAELDIDVVSENGDKVHIFCE